MWNKVLERHHVRLRPSLMVQMKYDGKTHTHTHVNTRTAMDRADGRMLQAASSGPMVGGVYSEYW